MARSVADAASAASPPPPTRQPISVVLGASCCAEVVTKFSFHPLDTLKTRLQFTRSASAAALGGDVRRLPLLRDMGDVLQLMRRDSSIVRALYRGLTPALLGALPTAMVYMPTYEFTKSALQDTPFAPMAGCVTGVVSSVVRVPVAVIKAKLQVQLYNSMLEAVRGTSKLYAGFRATCLLDVTYALVQFGTLERLHAWRTRGNSTGHDAATGFLAGAVAAICTEPIDVVRTRIMVQSPTCSVGGSGGKGGGGGKAVANFGYRGVGHGFRRVVAEEGLGALWKGLLPRLVLKSCGAALWYSVYISAQQHLGAA